MRFLWDSTVAADIPVHATMVAGYIDGVSPWSPADWARFPTAVKVRIARNSLTDDGHVLDVEAGDALPGWAPAWAQRRRSAGVPPTVYCNRGNLQAVRDAFHAQHVPEPRYWLSTLDGTIPWLPGVIAVQHLGSPASGGHFDVSVVQDYWPGVDPRRTTMANLTGPIRLAAGDGIRIPGPDQTTNWNVTCNPRPGTRCEFAVNAYAVDGTRLTPPLDLRVLDVGAEVYGTAADLGATGPCQLEVINDGPGELILTLH